MQINELQEMLTDVHTLTFKNNNRIQIDVKNNDEKLIVWIESEGRYIGSKSNRIKRFNGLKTAYRALKRYEKANK